WRAKGPTYLATSGTVSLAAGVTQLDMGLQATGDLNGDNICNVQDFALLSSNFGHAGAPPIGPSTSGGEGKAGALVPLDTPTNTPTPTNIPSSCVTPATSTLLNGPTMNARLNLIGTPSACAANKPCPGSATSGAIHYKAYIFQNANNTTECITINVSTICS